MLNNGLNNGLTDVAVAVITKSDGSFLMAQRPAGKPYAGYWEFPGGKVEPNETVHAALLREIKEELGLDVTQAYPWVTQIFTYPHATVKLHFYRVTAWQGEPHPHEGQIFSWERAESVRVAPVLPANGPILRGLSLPPVMGVTNLADLGEAMFFARLEMALRRGLRLVQVREKNLADAALVAFARRVTKRAHAYGARVMLNAAPDLALKSGVDGLHLTAQRLMQSETRPDVAWCGASCHTFEELARAAQLQLDYALLGSVLPTASHPGMPSLGWEQVRLFAQDYPLPIYLIGGMQSQHLETAWECGAHGIAMLRGAW
jgi:8-oxo-dGTP diphosphatase